MTAPERAGARALMFESSLTEPHNVEAVVALAARSASAPAFASAIPLAKANSRGLGKPIGAGPPTHIRRHGQSAHAERGDCGSGQRCYFGADRRHAADRLEWSDVRRWVHGRSFRPDL